LVISELQVGGAEKNFVELACGLRNRGHFVQVYSLDPRPAPGSDTLVIRLEQAGIPCHFGKKTAFSALFSGHARALRRLWRADQVQVVCSFLLRANLAATWAATAPRWNRGTGNRGTGNCGSAAPTLVLGLRQADPRRWARWLEQLCLRRANATICVSSQVAQGYRNDGPIAEPAELQPNCRGQIVVIPNGVTIPEVPPTLPADLPNGLAGLPCGDGPWPILLYVGRLAPQKGLDRLLHLAPELLGRLPNHHLVLVGQGPQEAALRAQIATSDVRSRIHLLGWRPNPRDYIAASAVVLLHSRWEGLPNALLEAMSLAKPVVTTRSQGVDDLFPPNSGDVTVGRGDLDGPGAAQAFERDGEVATAAVARCCQVVPQGAAAEFVAAVERIAKSPKLAEKLGDWNRNRVQSAFSIDRFLTAHEQVFLMLAGRCQHPGEGPKSNLTIS
jgi:glycosyltransferase involved in cell wall biosynthesis